MLKLAFIASTGLYSPNGVASYVRRISGESSRFEQHSVELIGPFCSSLNRPVETQTLTRLPNVKQKIKEIMSRTKIGSRLAIHIGFEKNALKAIKRYEAYQDHADVLVFNDPYSLIEFIKRHPKHDERIAIVTHDNGEFGKMILDMYPKVGRRFVDRLREQSFSAADSIVLVGEKSLSTFKSNYPRWSKKAIHIHSGIQADGTRGHDRKNRGERPVIACVGTINGRKNQIMLLKALQTIGEHERPIVWLIGDGPDYLKCSEYMASHDLSDSVVMWGNQQNVFSLLEKADCFISVSRDEGLPIAALEAMSMSLPLILTDVGSCSDLIDGNGLLIKPDDINEVADSLRFISKYDGNLERMGARSRKLFLKSYTMASMTAEYASLCVSLMSDSAI